MNTRILAVAAIVTTAVAGIASADTVNMAFQGTGSGSNVRVTFFGNSPTNVFAGQLRHNITSATGQATSLLGERRTFCADFEQFVSSSSSVFTVVAPADLLVRGTPMGVDRANALSNIYSAFGNAAIDSAASNTLGSAFQVAVWEILYDYNANVGLSSINLTSGNIKFTKTDGSALSSSFVNQFNAIIAGIGSGNFAGGLLGLQSSARQDQLVFGSNLIPTPGAAAVAGLGALAMLRRRR